MNQTNKKTSSINVIFLKALAFLIYLSAIPTIT